MSLLNLVLSFFRTFDIHRAKVSCGSACRYLFESVVERGGGGGEELMMSEVYLLLRAKRVSRG
jgi:hypothetical protein